MTSETDHRTYTPEEERTLTQNLLVLTQALHRGELRARPLDITFLRDMHAGLFRGVRAHAGRLRARGYGEEYVIFGPYRSEHRDKVEKRLEQLLRASQREMDQLDASVESYDLDVLRLAIRAHADIIKVHPFEDGNGRTGRLCANHVLVKHGMRPIAIEVVKQDYTELLNHYYDTGDIEPLVDLYLCIAGAATSY